MTPSPPNEILFRAWLEDYRGIIVKVTRSFAFSFADATELEQELKLQLWISLKHFSGQAKPSTWIYRVCLNTALTWRRGTSRRESHIERTADITLLANETVSPADRASDRELLEKLYAAIQDLPDFDRALVLLSLDELPYREIAEITGLSENHVGVALARARKRLATLLEGVTDELE